MIERIKELLEQMVNEARKAGAGAPTMPEKTADEIIAELQERAIKELNITGEDNAEMTYEEGFRILDLQEVEKQKIKFIQIKYERVYRFEQGGEYHSDDPVIQVGLDRAGWQPMEGHEKDGNDFRSRLEFEDDLGWVYFSNYMKATLKIVTVITVVGTAPIAIVYAGPKMVIISVIASVGTHVIVKLVKGEKFTAEGFLMAVVEGIVGALGFKLLMPVGGFAAGLLGRAGGSFGIKVGQFVVKTGITGGGTGAFTLVGSQLIEDMLFKDNPTDIAVYIAKAKAGFFFGFLIEFGGAPILRQLGKALEPVALKIKDMKLIDVWNAAKDKLTRQDLTTLPKQLFEAAQGLKVRFDMVFKDPKLISSMMDKSQSVFKELYLSVRQAPGIYIKEFEIIIYENALFLAQKTWYRLQPVDLKN